MNTSLVSVSTEDGLTLQGLLFMSGEDSRTLVIHVHSAFSNFFEHFYYLPLAQALNKDNIDILYINTRGRDYYADYKRVKHDKIESIRIGGTLEIFNECLRDIAPWIEQYKDRYEKMVLQGHSLGAMKVVHYIKERGNKDICGVSLFSPPDIEGFLESIIGTETDAFKQYAADEMLSAGELDKLRKQKLMPERAYIAPISVQTYDSILNHPEVTGMFYSRKKEYMRKSGIGEIMCPTLVIYGDREEVIGGEVSSYIRAIKDEIGGKVDAHILIGANHNYQFCEEDLSSVVSSWFKENDL